MKTLLNLLTAVLLGMLVVSCDSSTESEDEDTSDIPGLVNIPTTETSIADNHPDINAQVVRSNVESMGIYAFMFDALAGGFNSYNWVKNGNTYTHSLQGGGEEIKYVATDQASNWIYQIYLTGELDGYNITNGLWFEGTYSKDGKTGEYTIYSYTASDKKYKDIQFSWTTAANGTITHLLTYKDSETDTKLTTYQAVIKTDKSGTSEWKLDDVLSWTAIWNADGSGSMITYDTDGNEEDTFNWTKNP